MPKNLNQVEARYLSEIYRMTERHEELATGALASKFNVRPASVVDVLNRLMEKGLISRPGWGRIELTGSGRSVAMKIIHNHRILELYFRDRLGLQMNETCKQAQRIDYLIGDVVVSRMCEDLGYPTNCVHGFEVRHVGCRRS